jgi:hypothetical protein
VKEYPSILSCVELLTRFKGYEGKSFVAFDKLDGSNVRAEWSRKKGWHKFGSRRQMLDESHPFLGGAIPLILSTYGDSLAKELTDNPALHKPERATAYFEYLGPNSFAGQHDPQVLGVESNAPMRVVLIDLNVHRRGFVAARDFIKHLAHLGIPRIIHRGELDRDFVSSVRSGVYDVVEGVVCKGGEGHGLWMAKVKTSAYLERLKTFFGGEWEKYGE